MAELSIPTSNPFTLTPDFLRMVVQEIESEENLARKRYAWDSDQVRTGKLKGYVQTRIKEMYPKTHTMYSVADYSVLKKVTDKLAKAYKEAPVRKIAGDENKNSAEIYSKICDKYALNQAMKDLDTFYCQHRYGLLACFMDREPMATAAQPMLKFKFYALAPYEYDVIKDADGNVKVVILSYPPSSLTSGSGDGYDALIAESGMSDEAMKERKYTFWTDEGYAEAIVSGKKGHEVTVTPAYPTAGGKNPYGVLPFVFTPMDYSVNYPNNNPLPEQTVEFNALLSVYLTSANMQVGVLKITRPEKQKLTIASQSMYTAIEVPQSSRPEDKPSDISFIAPTPNMDGHKDAIVTYLTTILDEQGITGNAVINPSESYTSGLDRLIASADVQHIIEDNQELYQKVEQQVYRIVSKQLASQGQPVLPDEGFQIIYRKPRIMISDKEKLENLKLMKELNLWADYELIQAYDPNLSAEEAKKKLQEIEEERAQRRAENAKQGLDEQGKPLPVPPENKFNGGKVADKKEEGATK